MQTATGQDRQARGLCQAGCIALSFQGHSGGLIAAPGQVTPFAPGPKHHDRIGALGQGCPLVARQRGFTLKEPGAPLHHHRQAHQPETAHAQRKTPSGKARS
ncbi:hypothetical protein D3C75_1042320 [compost metagenome]